MSPARAGFIQLESKTVYASRQVQRAIAADKLRNFLKRHISGDRGCLGPAGNGNGRHEQRFLSAYHLDAADLKDGCQKDVLIIETAPDLTTSIYFPVGR